MSPTQAATVAMETIALKNPTFVGAVVAANKNGEFGNCLAGRRYLSCRVNYFHIPTNQMQILLQMHSLNGSVDPDYSTSAKHTSQDIFCLEAI